MLLFRSYAILFLSRSQQWREEYIELLFKSWAISCDHVRKMEHGAALDLLVLLYQDKRTEKNKFFSHVVNIKRLNKNNIMGIFKKKSPIEKLYRKHEKLLRIAHALSTSDRSASDAKYAEAQAILDRIDAMEAQVK